MSKKTCNFRKIFTVSDIFCRLIFATIFLFSTPLLAESSSLETTEPQLTPCQKSVLDTSQKLMALFKVWLRHEGNSLEKRQSFLKNLLSLAEPQNPFANFTSRESIQVERAAGLYFPISQQQWEDFKLGVQEVLQNEIEQQQQIADIDEDAALIKLQFQQEGVLEGGQEPFVGKPQWIQTPSGKRYLLAMRKTKRKADPLVEYQLYRYYPEQGTFEFVLSIDDIKRNSGIDARYFNSFDVPVKVVESSIDEERFLISTKKDGYLINTLFEVNFGQRPSIKNLISIVGHYPFPEVTIHEDYTYFSTAFVPDNFETPGVEFRPLPNLIGGSTHNFLRLDLKNMKLETLFQTSFEDKKAFNNSVDKNTGNIIWFDNHDLSPHVIAEFYPSSERFDYWHPSSDVNDNRITKYYEEPKRERFRFFKRKPIVRIPALQPILEMPFGNGKLTKVTTHSGKTLSFAPVKGDPSISKRLNSHFVLHENGSNLEDPPLMTLSSNFHYHSATLIESNSGKLYLLMVADRPKEFGLELNIFSMDPSTKNIDQIGTIEIERLNKNSIRLMNRQDGRIAFLIDTSKKGPQLVELDTSTNSLVILDSSYFKASISQDLDSTEVTTNTRIAGIDPQGNLTVLKVGGE